MGYPGTSDGVPSETAGGSRRVPVNQNTMLHAINSNDGGGGGDDRDDMHGDRNGSYYIYIYIYITCKGC